MTVAICCFFFFVVSRAIRGCFAAPARPPQVQVEITMVVPVQLVTPPPTPMERDFAQWSDEMELDR